jgi:hypothetical protein
MTRCNPYRLVGGAMFMGVIFSLSACGGSSSSGLITDRLVTTPSPNPPDLTRFNKQVATGREDFAALTTTPGLPSAEMPVTGGASYSGMVLYKTASSVSGLPGEVMVDKILESPSMSSNITLTATFGLDSIFGTLNDFNDSTTGSLTGSVYTQNGTITGNEFEGDLSGSFLIDGRGRDATGAIIGFFGGSVTPDVAGGSLSLDLGAGDQFLGIFSAD